MNQRLNFLSDRWRERVAAAVEWLADRGVSGRVGLVLGSGLGNFVDAVTQSQAIDYGTIPGFAAPTVAEHAGRLVCGEAGGVPVVVMQGRHHAYEGLPAEEMLLPTAVLACMGIEAALITNAAGGLNRFFEPGDLMVIRDHVDFHLDDPLRGLLEDDPHGRTARLSRLYDPDLARELLEAGAAAGVPLHVGTYASVYGPSYETRAEIGLLRRAGCDAGGMSTAPETVLLSRLGVRIVGLSCITNPSRETDQPELFHADVVETGKKVRDKLARLLLAFLARLQENK